MLCLTLSWQNRLQSQALGNIIPDAHLNDSSKGKQSIWGIMAFVVDVEKDMPRRALHPLGSPAFCESLGVLRKQA